jgi:small subunit ribosomal protein S3
MGQKVHPEGFRLGVKRKGEKVDYKSSWYSDRDYAELLGEDLKIRDHIEKKLNRAGIADIQIRKAAEQGEIAVDIHTARPGIVIGKGRRCRSTCARFPGRSSTPGSSPSP